MDIVFDEFCAWATTTDRGSFIFACYRMRNPNKHKNRHTIDTTTAGFFTFFTKKIIHGSRLSMVLPLKVVKRLNKVRFPNRFLRRTKNYSLNGTRIISSITFNSKKGKNKRDVQSPKANNFPVADPDQVGPRNIFAHGPLP